MPDVSAPDGYGGIKLSKTGMPVPVFGDGTALHSLYDPVREAKQLIDTISDETFVVFAGIGGGFHIREYLARYPGRDCIVAESSPGAIDRLSELIGLSDVLSDGRVTVIDDCTDGSVKDLLSRTYLPALHGDFRLVPLRSWQARHARELSVFAEDIRESLAGISADFSVQSHFGKLWFRNFFLNIATASTVPFIIPEATGGGPGGKKAVVAAAGPGLETFLGELLVRRDSYVIFSTDTAYGTLVSSGIVPDYFVSIDAQPVSARHAMHHFSPATTIIIDLCGNPDIALRARESGAPVLFAAGGHPLARYASDFAYLPAFDTSSGTVTLAALDAAHSLGYSDVIVPGADFAYINGKPYARGTYLEDQYLAESNRIRPMECMYTALMFRTPVSRTVTEAGITYGTAVLDGYAAAFRNTRGYRHEPLWRAGVQEPFPYKRFVAHYRNELEALGKIVLAERQVRTSPAFITLLPLIAWYRTACSRHGDESSSCAPIKLALDLIAGYTDAV